MADDLYEAIINGGGAGDRASVIAQALRRRRNMGELGVLTGDKVLGSSGKDLSSSADEYAQLLQQGGQDKRRQDQTQQYQTGQLDHMANSLAETKRNNDLDHQYQMAMAAAAKDRADKEALKKFKTIPATEKQKAVGIRQGIDVLTEMEKTFKPEFAGQKNIPGIGILKNTAAANQVGPEVWQRQQAWYSNLERLYNLQERYKLFGATLTANELKSWAQANLNPNMSAKQIREKLATLKSWAGNELSLHRQGYATDEFNPEEVTGVFGAEEGGLGDGASLDAQGGGGAPKPKRWVQQEDGTFKAQ